MSHAKLNLTRMPMARAGGLLLAIAAISLTSGCSLNDLRAVAMQEPFPATSDAANGRTSASICCSRWRYGSGWSPR